MLKMFIKEFTTLAAAEKFARTKGGAITIRYDYDSITHSILKFYRVRY